MRIQRPSDTEKVFLRMTLPYLVPGGVLVYIIPQTRLNRGIARLLASPLPEDPSLLYFPILNMTTSSRWCYLGCARRETLLMRRWL